MDGDGHLDAVTANSSNTVSVFFGNGDGTVRPKLSFGAGRSPAAVAIGDLNGDGRPDLAVANHEGNTVSTLFNRGGAAAPRPARTFLVGGRKTIPIGAGRPNLCLWIEPVGQSFELSDVDPSSLRMISEGTGSVSGISAVSAKSTLTGDADGNGIQEISACFARSDLASLFSEVRGRRVVPVEIEGGLSNGGKFRATLVLTVVRTGIRLTALVTPNPLLREGALSVTTKTPGFVRARIFDASGRLVRVIADFPAAPAGEHTFSFDGRGPDGVRLSSGIYFYRVETRDGEITGKFVIAR